MQRDPSRRSRSAAQTPSAVFRLQKREETYRDVLMRLFVLLKTASIDEDDADLFEVALDELVLALERCLRREGTLVIGERDGYLFLNGVRAKLDLDGFAALKFLVQVLIARELSGILFEEGISERELRAFLELFLKEKPAGGVGHEFGRKLRQSGVVNIHPILRTQAAVEASQGEVDVPNEAFSSDRSYFKNIFVIKHLLEGVGPSCFQTRRASMHVVQQLANNLLQDDSFLVMLERMRQWDFSLFKHSINVAILVTVLGRRIGLPPLLLDELGVAALFHDIGMVDLDIPASEREAQLEAVEADPERHMRLSFRRIVSIGKDKPIILRMALVAKEHHVLDTGEDDAASLLANLIQVTERFEHLISRPDQNGRLRATQQAVDVCVAEATETTRPIVELLAKIVAESSAA